MQLSSALEKLRQREDLTRDEARGVMRELLSGRASDDEIVAVLAALRDKSETFDEVAGLAEVMREQAAGVLRDAGVDAEKLAEAGPLLDTCGTGGDGKGTFNVSTAAALVASASGARVAKHGNRSISSRAGSADVLEALGVAIELPLRHIPECLEETRIVFLYAPHLHLAMKHVMNARRRLKTKTVFNLLGPLTNPLRASAQLAGVFDRNRTEMMAKALAVGGAQRAFVVASHSGMDEISISGPTQLSEARDGTISTRDINPAEFGFSGGGKDGVAGGSARENAEIIQRVLEGEQSEYRDMVLVNTSAALVAAGIGNNFRESAEIAAQAIDSGAAMKTLAALRAFTQAHRS